MCQPAPQRDTPVDSPPPSAELVAKLRTRYPEHVRLQFTCGDGPEASRMTRERFLMSQWMTGAQVYYVVRRRLKLRKEEALFLMVDGARRHLVPAHEPLHTLVHATPRESCR